MHPTVEEEVDSVTTRYIGAKEPLLIRLDRECTLRRN